MKKHTPAEIVADLEESRVEMERAAEAIRSYAAESAFKESSEAMIQVAVGNQLIADRMGRAVDLLRKLTKASG